MLYVPLSDDQILTESGKEDAEMLWHCPTKDLLEMAVKISCDIFFSSVR
jgi:hypothetical protein